MEEGVKLLVTSWYIKTELKQTVEYKIVERQGEYKIKYDDDFFVIYSYGLATFLLLSKLPVINTKTNEDFNIKGQIFHEDFYNGFIKGRQHFKEKFIENRFQSKDTIAETLYRYYFHEKIGNSIGWKSYTENTTPMILTTKTLENWGYYSGIIYELKEFMLLNKELFKDFDKNKKMDEKPSSYPNKIKLSATEIAYLIYYTNETKYQILDNIVPSQKAWDEAGIIFKKNSKNIQMSYNEIYSKRDLRLSKSRGKIIQKVIDWMGNDYPNAVGFAKDELNHVSDY